jgi:hypothetical protein
MAQIEEAAARRKACACASAYNEFLNLARSARDMARIPTLDEGQKVSIADVMERILDSLSAAENACAVNFNDEKNFIKNSRPPGTTPIGMWTPPSGRQFGEVIASVNTKIRTCSTS